MARHVRNGGAATNSSRGAAPGGDDGGGDTGSLPPMPPPCPTAGQQVREQAISAGNPGRELPEKRQPGVDEGALAVPDPQQAPGERLLAGIVHGQRGLILRIPLTREVEAPLLDPP